MNLKVYSRRQLMTSKPYDAEIEYLETQGNCSIITNCVPSGSYIAISAKFFFIGYTSSSQYISWYQAYTSDNMQCFRATRYTTQICLSNGSQGSRAPSDPRYAVSSENIYEIETNGTSVTVNGTTKTTRAINSNSNTSAMIIFSSKFQGRCYYFTILDNGRLILDCIPVRVGNVGYMYDRVSGQLFGNIGTGNFILGPDI